MPITRENLSDLVWGAGRKLRSLGVMPRNAKELPCHFYSLFVDVDGTISPCCNSSSRPIGHISQIDLLELGRYLPTACHCSSSPLGHLSYEGPIAIRAASKEEEPRVGVLHVVSTLNCQAGCAHCVQALERETRARYPFLAENVLNLVDEIHTSLERVFIQGGEIGIDRNSISLLRRIKEQYPHVITRVISNGCLGEADVEWFTACVDEAYFSFVGFSEGSYWVGSKLNLKKTVDFVEKVVGSGRVRKVVLKYLITPINLHETLEFLEWCERVAPDGAVLISAVDYFDRYITKFSPASPSRPRFSHSIQRWLGSALHHSASLVAPSQGHDRYDYWTRIISRSSRAIQHFVHQREFSSGTRIVFDERAQKLLGL